MKGKRAREARKYHKWLVGLAANANPDLNGVAEMGTENHKLFIEDIRAAQKILYARSVYRDLKKSYIKNKLQEYVNSNIYPVYKELELIKEEYKKQNKNYGN